MTHFLPPSPAAFPAAPAAAGSASCAAEGIGRGNNTTNSSRLLGSRQEKEMEEEEAEEGMNPPLEKRRRRKGMMLVKDINDPRGEEEEQKEEEGPSDHPPHKNSKKSIFVPLLNSKIGVPPTALEVPREMAPSAGNDYCHRPMKLAILLSLLLLTGTFALFDSLIDNSSQDEDSNGQEVKTDDELSEDDVKGYLNRFGYIGESGKHADQPVSLAHPPDMVYAQQKHRTADQLLGDFSLNDLRSAIQRFQEFAGLPTTGELDNRTKKKMKQPRCGMQDVEMIRTGSGDGILKWRKRQLTYKIEHYTAHLPHYMQKKAIQMAFNAWAKHIPLDFSEASTGQADIRVRFARRTHGDPWPFDGRGGVLAHATFPSDGQLHFDDDEQWAFMDAAKIASYRYTDLFWVALHEIGHILGLSHSKVETAIMAPFYQDPEGMIDWRGNYKQPELTNDDIRAAQQIYGRRSSSSSQPEQQRPVGRGNERRNGGGHYDDSEGGFLSQLGKFLGGGGNTNGRSRGNEEEDKHGGDWDQRRNIGSDRRRQRQSEEEEEEGTFTGFFSSSAPTTAMEQPMITTAILIFSSLLIPLYFMAFP